MTEDELRKQAWDFFQTQASQRLTTFNFYLVLSSLLSTGFIATSRPEFDMPHLSVTFGFLLVLFSFIFWKLDQRNRGLIKGAEETLKFFEKNSNFQDIEGIPHIAKRFVREEFYTNQKKANRSWCIWRNQYTYSECFRAVFMIFGTAGFAGTAWTVWRLVK